MKKATSGFAPSMRQREELAAAYRGAVIRPGELPLLDDACRLGPAVGGQRHRGQPARAGRLARAVSAAARSWSCRCWWPTSPSARCWPTMCRATHMFSPRRVRICHRHRKPGRHRHRERPAAGERGRTRPPRAASWSWRTTFSGSCCPSEAPTLPGYQIVYRWRSAREVGGDFFDFVPLGPWPAGAGGGRRRGQGHPGRALHDVCPHSAAHGRASAGGSRSMPCCAPTSSSWPTASRTCSSRSTTACWTAASMR